MKIIESRQQPKRKEEEIRGQYKIREVRERQTDIERQRQGERERERGLGGHGETEIGRGKDGRGPSREESSKWRNTSHFLTTKSQQEDRLRCVGTQGSLSPWCGHPLAFPLPQGYKLPRGTHFLRKQSTQAKRWPSASSVCRVQDSDLSAFPAGHLFSRADFECSPSRGPSLGE